MKNKCFMSHPILFDDFSPSVKEAMLFEEEWNATKGEDYQRYKEIVNAFANTEISVKSLQEKCIALNNAYHCRGTMSYHDIATHLYSIIKDTANWHRLLTGDPQLVDEIRNAPGGNLYVLASMFCHHSNPCEYFGFTGKVKILLTKLNERKPHFLVHRMYMRRYQYFDDNMRAFIARYHLESLNRTQLDIMISRAFDLYENQLI